MGKNPKDENSSSFDDKTHFYSEEELSKVEGKVVVEDKDESSSWDSETRVLQKKPTPPVPKPKEPPVTGKRKPPKPPRPKKMPIADEGSVFDEPTRRWDLSRLKGSWDGLASDVTRVLKIVPEHIPKQDMTRERLENIDIARGIAIALMMLSHTVMALNTYSMLPDYAFVPIHLVTKLSSSLFILVFGISIARFYLPLYGSEKWAGKRKRLIWRSFNLLLWYKILTVVQMFQTREKEFIVDTLLFKHFTDFVEVLNFYWLVILWIILLIPLWVRMTWWMKLVTIFIIAYSGILLEKHFDFFGVWQLKAIFVEYPGTFCYGQFQRGALALLGVFFAGLVLKKGRFSIDKYWLGLIYLTFGSLTLFYFLHITGESTGYRDQILMKIAKNWGKHPPNLEFSLFSMAGASLLLGFSMIIPSKLTFLLKPFSLIGKEAFFCFNWHIILIFVGFRFIMNLRWDISYTETLALYGVVFTSSFLLAPINTYIKRKGLVWKLLLP